LGLGRESATTKPGKRGGGGGKTGPSDNAESALGSSLIGRRLTNELANLILSLREGGRGREKRKKQAGVVDEIK